MSAGIVERLRALALDYGDMLRRYETASEYLDADDVAMLREAAARIEAQDAEIAALRAALTDIARTDWRMSPDDEPADALIDAMKIAKAAIARAAQETQG